MSASLELYNFFSARIRSACKASSMILPLPEFNGGISLKPRALDFSKFFHPIGYVSDSSVLYFSLSPPLLAQEFL